MEDYLVSEIKSLKEIRDYFPDGKSEDHWLFLSVGGKHGTNITLDDIERIIRGEDPFWKPINDSKFYVTVLVVHPKRTAAVSGKLPLIEFSELLISQDDVDFLRKCIKSTFISIKKSQEGNL